MSKLYELKETQGPLENMVNLTFTDKGLKEIPEDKREKAWTDMLLHIHNCETRRESYEKAKQFLSERFK